MADKKKGDSDIKENINKEGVLANEFSNLAILLMTCKPSTIPVLWDF